MVWVGGRPAKVLRGDAVDRYAETKRWDCEELIPCPKHLRTILPSSILKTSKAKVILGRLRRRCLRWRADTCSMLVLVADELQADGASGPITVCLCHSTCSRVSELHSSPDFKV